MLIHKFVLFKGQAAGVPRAQARGGGPGAARPADWWTDFGGGTRLSLARRSRGSLTSCTLEHNQLACDEKVRTAVTFPWTWPPPAATAPSPAAVTPPPAAAPPGAGDSARQRDTFGGTSAGAALCARICAALASASDNVLG